MKNEIKNIIKTNILAMIKAGSSKPIRFHHIHHRVGLEHCYRDVDKEIQSLRRRGLIRYSAARGWLPVEGI